MDGRDIGTVIFPDADVKFFIFASPVARARRRFNELRAKGVNALVLYLGNFGPEGPTTILAQKFDGPVMVAAAAEESGKNLVDRRGDAYCGLLNTSYNLGLRKLRPHVPEYPVGTPEEVAAMIAGFVPEARVLLGLRALKVFAFGPRPQDFLACNAPIKPLYDLLTVMKGGPSPAAHENLPESKSGSAFGIESRQKVSGAILDCDPDRDELCIFTVGLLRMRLDCYVRRTSLGENPLRAHGPWWLRPAGWCPGQSDR